jgi:hypothetical protein
MQAKHVTERGDRKILDQLKTYPAFKLPEGKTWLELSVTLNCLKDDMEVIIPPVVCAYCTGAPSLSVLAIS